MTISAECDCRKGNGPDARLAILRLVSKTRFGSALSEFMSINLVICLYKKNCEKIEFCKVFFHRNFNRQSAATISQLH